MGFNHIDFTCSMCKTSHASDDLCPGMESSALPDCYALLDRLAARVVDMCKTRKWSMHWTHRGAYLRLEASELIEAIRGKHGDPKDEAGDVLLVLMSITEYAGIPFSDVIAAATKKLAHLETAPTYPGEEHQRP